MIITTRCVYEKTNNSVSHYYMSSDLEIADIFVNTCDTKGMIDTGILENGMNFIAKKDSIIIFNGSGKQEFTIDEYAFFSACGIVIVANKTAKLIMYNKTVELDIEEPKIITSNYHGVILKDKNDFIHLVYILKDEITKDKFEIKAEMNEFVPGPGFVIKNKNIFIDNSTEKVIKDFNFNQYIFSVRNESFIHYTRGEFRKQDTDDHEILNNNRWEFHDGILFVYLKKCHKFVYGGRSIAIPESIKQVFTVYANEKAYFFFIDHENKLFYLDIPKVTLVTDLKPMPVKIQDNDVICQKTIETIANCLIIKTNNEFYRIFISKKEIIKLINLNVDRYAYLIANFPIIDSEIVLEGNKNGQELISVIAHHNKIKLDDDDITSFTYKKASTWIRKNSDNFPTDEQFLNDLVTTILKLSKITEKQIYPRLREILDDNFVLSDTEKIIKQILKNKLKEIN